MNKAQIRTEVSLMIGEFIASGGKITQGKLRNKAPKFMKYLGTAAKKATYARAYSKPAGYRTVDFEFAGNNACGYSTKYMVD